MSQDRVIQEFIMQQVKPPVELRKTYWAVPCHGKSGAEYGNMAL